MKNTKVQKTKSLAVRFDGSEMAQLEQLASEAGRSKSAVVRRLLTLADIPLARQRLGIPSGQEPEEKVCQTAK